jgi:hypothetical protein
VPVLVHHRIADPPAASQPSTAPTNSEGSGAELLSAMGEPAAFFAGWVLVGVAVALAGVRHGGHDRRTLLALGAGLGPLTLVVAAALGARERPVVRAFRRSARTTPVNDG